MTSAFALMMTVFLITGESQNVITGIYASKESCLQASVSANDIRQ